MKKIMMLLVAAMVAALPVLSIAQGGPPGGMTPDMQKKVAEAAEKSLKETAKELNLKPDQITKLRALNKSMMAKMSKIFSGKGDMQAKQTEMMGLQKTAMAELKKILTAEQYKKMQAKMSGMRGGPGAKGPGGN